MSIGLRFAPLRNLAPRAFLLLALLAVSAVLAAPICDALELPGEVHEEQCCASLNDGTPVAPTAATSTCEPPAFVAYVAWSPDWRAVRWPAAAIPPDRPPLTRPYYTRSARILI
jgi:hypothetical protein